MTWAAFAAESGSKFNRPDTNIFPHLHCVGGKMCAPGRWNFDKNPDSAAKSTKSNLMAIIISGTKFFWENLYVYMYEASNE